MACIEYKLNGIEEVYISEVSGDTVNYYISGTSIILDEIQEFYRLPVVDESTTYNEKKVTDAKGLYYQQNLDFFIPDSHSDVPHTLLNKSLAMIIKDESGYYIGGFEEPMSIDKIESKNDKDNTTQFNISNNSYYRIKPLANYLHFVSGDTNFTGITAPTFTGFTFSINNNLFNMYSATGITFAFWITLSTGLTGSYQSIFERFLSYDSTFIPDETIFFNSSGTFSATSSDSLTPGDKYLVVLRASGSNTEIWLKSATDAGSSDSVGGWSGLPNSPDQLFKLHVQNEIRSFGVWNRYLNGTEVDNLYFFHGDRSEVTYAQLSAGYKTGLIAFYDNDIAIDSHTSTIQDKHTNNLHLTRES